MKAKIIISIALAMASAILTAPAQNYISASITFLPLSGSGTVTFDGSSLQLAGTLFAFGGTSIGIPSGSTVTPYTGDLTGLSAIQTPESITGYLAFTGYRFDLTSISEMLSSGDVDVLGAGTLVDLSNTYSPTPATFSFSSSSSSPSSNFSGSVVAMAPVPEPGMLSLLGLGVGALTLLRRRN